MSLLQGLQSFIGEVLDLVNGKDNPLGLTALQIDEINQIIALIKNILSDGIQRGDIGKLVYLLGEIGEQLPEMFDQIQNIIKDLKKLEKQLFPSDSLSMLDLLEGKDNSKKVPLSEDGTSLGSLADLLVEDGMDLADQPLLQDTRREEAVSFFDIAERILNLVNDRLIMKTQNFDKIDSILKKIEHRAGKSLSQSNHSDQNGLGSDQFFDNRVNQIDRLNNDFQNKQPNTASPDAIGGNSTINVDI